VYDHGLLFKARRFNRADNLATLLSDSGHYGPANPPEPPSRLIAALYNFLRDRAA